MKEEVREHLEQKLIPFWKALKDDRFGGYFGYVGYDLEVEREAVKGCILMSRITWFFSQAAVMLKDPELVEYADWGYRFLTEHCMDREEGGVYWSVTFDGKPLDTTKHTYNQAFAIYALSAYYEASGDGQALKEAEALYHLIETKMRDEGGYLEAFDRSFRPVSNEKLSENGVSAARTMNTLLHVMEAYTELYRVTGHREVRKSIISILESLESKVWNPVKRRQEVFFDADWNSLIDLYSYGHDIETAWLTDRTLEILGDEELTERIGSITEAMTDQVYREAFDGRSLPAEAENGTVKEDRIWWVQAETVTGFLNGWQKRPDRKEYLEAARSAWDFIRAYVADKREGSEWFWYVTKEGVPAEEPIVEPWKCPYHNGRMCMEVIRRLTDMGMD